MNLIEMHAKYVLLHVRIQRYKHCFQANENNNQHDFNQNASNTDEI
jgi:hypothetical protein